MKRREFITLVRRRGGSVAARGARAAAERVRRIGVVMTRLGDDPDLQARMQCCGRAAAIGLDRRPQHAVRPSLGAGDSDVVRNMRRELVALAPDLILASGSQTWRRCNR